jgi:pimeloyl-ACP methyl ester carboxylesterase
MDPELVAVAETDGDWTYSARETTVGNGLRMHYVIGERVSSQADGRTLLALHGMGSYGGAWRAVIRHVPAVSTVVLPDLRGHGQSDWTREGYWLADYARDIEELVAQLDLRGFDLGGHSLGARISMVLAPRLGTRVRTVTLSDTGPEVSREGALKAKSIAATGSTSKSFRDAEAVRAGLREEHPDWVQESIDLRARTLYRRNWADRWVTRGDPEVEYLLGRAGLKEVQDMWDGLAATTVPTLLVRGMQSYLLDDQLAKRMCDKLKDPVYVALDLSHEMLYVRPDLFGAVVDEFLRAH